MDLHEATKGESAMTTVNSIDVACSNCGAKSPHMVLGSTNQFGSPDLDLRPPKMARSTMSYWLQECPHCGLVAPQLDAAERDDQGILTAPEYARTRADGSIPPLARRFLCRAIIVAARDDPEDAFYQSLSAAWVADDSDLEDLARTFRLKAAAFLQGLATADPELQVQLLDVLRRAGAWDAAAALSKDLAAETLEPPLPRIVSFQGALIGRQDRGRYTVDQALKQA